MYVCGRRQWWLAVECAGPGRLQRHGTLGSANCVGGSAWQGLWRRRARATAAGLAAVARRCWCRRGGAEKCRSRRQKVHAIGRQYRQMQPRLQLRLLTRLSGVPASSFLRWSSVHYASGVEELSLADSRSSGYFCFAKRRQYQGRFAVGGPVQNALFKLPRWRVSCPHP